MAMRTRVRGLGEQGLSRCRDRDQVRPRDGHRGQCRHRPPRTNSGHVPAAAVATVATASPRCQLTDRCSPWPAPVVRTACRRASRGRV